MKEIIIGLIAVMIANILLGATLSKFKENFKWSILFKGVFKALCVVLGISLVFLCGYLNPTILAVNIDGTNVNLIEALRLIFIAGIIFYGKEDLVKIKDLLKLNLNIKDIEEIETEVDNNEISISR